VDVDDTLADAALDLAAPVKAAATALERRRSERVVAASAAQQLAAVRRQTVPPSHAPPPVRPQRPGLVVRLAVVGRRGHVQELVLGRACAAPLLSPSTSRRPCAAGGRGAGPDEPRAGPVERRLDGRVVLGAQPVADVAERGQLVPAGAHVARARHSVALARRTRQPVHRLHAQSHKHRFQLK